eukprot:CAMPEP_0119034794 /NCGR_PEP_ID=MMETSP1177-20130426/1802_1 /TAXON_ID=2985 /ORGANISM="Ochromonas sp, Strain CCMP1899" /LENGTH=253 /DNA_ID=CAMNT_0006992497 /DNA_START=149 /DNA_END=907 /DNA_ORIENTATION=+
MKGQVISLWYTTKNILNDNPSKEPLTEDQIMKTSVLISKMRFMMLSLKGDFMDEDGTSIRYDMIKGSPKFQEYIDLTHQLKHISMAQMGVNEKKAFLINIYNSLAIHSLVEGLLKPFPGGTLSRAQMYASASYNIGGEIYSLTEIENGLLRGNRKGPAPFTKVPFSSKDVERKKNMVECDPRIHFALNCGAVSCPPIAVYAADILESQLDTATKGFIAGNTVVDTDKSSITVSTIFKWYIEDFGASKKNLLEW